MSVFFGRKLTNLINISSDPSNDDQSGKELNLEIRPSITSCKIGLFWTHSPFGYTVFFFIPSTYTVASRRGNTWGGSQPPSPKRIM